MNPRTMGEAAPRASVSSEPAWETVPPVGGTGISTALAGTLVANVLMLGCGAATGILAARLLLPEGRGLLAAVLFWPQLLASLGILGINDAIAYHAGRNARRLRELAAAGVWLALALGLLVAAATYLTLPWLLGPERRDVLWLSRSYTVVFVPANFLALVVLGRILGEQRFGRYHLLRMLLPATYLAGLLLLWVIDRASVSLVVLANLAATILVAVACATVDPSLLRMPRWVDIRVLLRDGAAFHVATGFMILAMEADRVVALRLFDDMTVGYYMIAFALAALPLGAVATTFHTVLFPRLAGSSPGERALLLRNGIRGATLILGVLAFPLLLLARDLIVLVFGRAFEPAGDIARILVVAFLLISLKHVIVRSIRGLGEARVGAFAEGLALGLFAVLVWPMASLWGAAGLAWALLLANMPVLAYLVAYLWRVHDLSPLSLLGFRRSTVRQLFVAARAASHSHIP